MIFYLILMFFLILYLFEVNKSKKTNFLPILLVTLMTIIAAFRLKDNDYKMYERYFYAKEIISTDLGYVYFMNFFKNFNTSYSNFLIFLNILFSYLIIKIFSYKNKEFFLTLIFYYSNLFFYYQMNQIRNLLAILVFLFFYILYIKIKEKKIIFLSMTAYFFHASTIILILSSFLNNFNKVKKKLGLILFISFLMGPFKLLQIFLNYIISLKIPIISWKLNFYMYLSKYSQVGSWTNLNLLRISIVSLIVIIFYKKLKSEYEKNIAFMLVLGNSIFILFNNISGELAWRISSNLTFVEPIVLGLLIGKFKNSQNRVFLYLLSVIYVTTNFIILNKIHTNIIKLITYY